MKLITATAFAFIAAAPGIVVQQPSPATIMARTVCFDEIRAFEAAYAKTGRSAAETADVVEDVLKSFVPAGEDRTNALTNFEAHKATVTGPGASPSDPAQLGVVLCASTVGAAADGGMRALDAFKAHWANERTTKFKLRPLPTPPVSPAASPAAAVFAAPAPPAPPMLTRNTRRVCANEIKAYEEDLLASGESADAVKNIIDDIVLRFIEDAQPRANVVDSFDEVSRQPGANPGDVKRLAASACVATMGTLWSVGMRDFAELNTHWAGRGRARFALAGHTAQPAASSCIWMEWEADGFGVPGVLRNECTFTVDLRFCVGAAKAGTPSEAIACEKGRSRFERIEPKSGVRTTLTEGTRINWVPCKAPMQPIETTAAGGPFTAVCK